MAYSYKVVEIRERVRVSTSTRRDERLYVWEAQATPGQPRCRG